MINKERLVQEFMEMVRIPSLSKKEGSFAQDLQKRLERIGVSVTVDDKGPAMGSETGNLWGYLPGNKKAPAVLFCSHLDTVVPGEGIEPIIKDEVIYSKGETILAADDKAGIAAILEALCHIQEEGIPHGEIEVLFTAGEEIGLLGSRCLEYSKIKSELAYILDSDGSPGTIINQGPAQDSIQAYIYGKAAHAGINPQEGINAIQVAARAINSMKLLRIDEETTANVGIIQGGLATNIVCDKVELKGEARSFNNDKLKKQTAHMTACLEGACQEMGAKAEIKTRREYPSFFLSPEEKVIQIAKKAAEKCGLSPKIQSSGGGSDTNFFNDKGVKAVNLGVGMKKVHTTEEYIKVEDLIGSARLVAGIIEEMAAESN